MMNANFDVTIEATVRKTIRVNASSETEATELAHGEFSVLPEEGVPEKYNEVTVSVEKIE
jgi:hypothetical protein